MERTPISAEEFRGLDGLDDWGYLQGAITADFRAGGFGAAGSLAAEIAAIADEADHHPDLDLRYPDHLLVTFTTHSAGGLTELDVTMARRVSAVAMEAGATADRPPMGTAEAGGR